jgi:excisionase family DNA binding protein
MIPNSNQSIPTAVGFLNVKEAGELLRVSPATIYGWVHQRKIPYRKHGSRLAFVASELTTWSETQRALPLDASSFSHVSRNDMVQKRHEQRRSLKIEQGQWQSSNRGGEDD